MRNVAWQQLDKDWSYFLDQLRVAYETTYKELCVEVGGAIAISQAHIDSITWTEGEPIVVDLWYRLAEEGGCHHDA